jgi:hypothetical protein
MTCFTRLKSLTRDFYLPVCLFFRVILMLPPLGVALNEAFGVETPLGLDALLDLDIPLGLDESLGVEAPLGLDALREMLARRNKQNREMEDTFMESGSTYLILLVRLNNRLNRLGRFLEHSTASKLVSGL